MMYIYSIYDNSSGESFLNARPTILLILKELNIGLKIIKDGNFFMRKIKQNQENMF